MLYLQSFQFEEFQSIYVWQIQNLSHVFTIFLSKMRFMMNSFVKQISSNSRTYNNDTYIPSTTINDAISNSNFCSTIQSWLRDLVTLQSNRRVSSFLERPWSKSSRPWSLDKIHRDIERLNRFNEHTDAIEVSKKMLQNGILGKIYSLIIHLISTITFRLSSSCRIYCQYIVQLFGMLFET